MSRIDRDLAGALKQAMKKSMHFALVISAPGEGTLIVSKNPIQPKAIAEAKEDMGGGQVVKGRCTGDKDGRLVFETAKEPPPTLTKTLKAVISRDAGLTLKVDARKCADLVDDEEPTAANANAPAQAAPKDPAAEAQEKQDAQYKEMVSKALQALASDINQARISRTAGALAIRTQLAKVQDLVERKSLVQAAQATVVLIELINEEKGILPPPDLRTPSRAPSMGPNTMTKEQEKEGKRIDWARQELRRVLGGHGHKHDPHTHVEPPRIQRVRPPAGR